MMMVMFTWRIDYDCLGVTKNHSLHKREKNNIDTGKGGMSTRYKILKMWIIMYIVIIYWDMLLFYQQEWSNEFIDSYFSRYLTNVSLS